MWLLPAALQALQHPYFSVGIRSVSQLVVRPALRERIQNASIALAAAAAAEQGAAGGRIAAPSPGAMHKAKPCEGRTSLAGSALPPTRRPHAAAESSLPALRGLVSGAAAAAEILPGNPLRRLVQLRQAGGGGWSAAGPPHPRGVPYLADSGYSSVRNAQYRPGASSAAAAHGLALLALQLGAAAALEGSTETPTKAFLAAQQRAACEGDSLDEFVPGGAPAPISGVVAAAPSASLQALTRRFRLAQQQKV